MDKLKGTLFKKTYLIASILNGMDDLKYDKDSECYTYFENSLNILLQIIEESGESINYQNWIYQYEDWGE